MSRINWPLAGALVVMGAILVFLYSVKISVAQEHRGHPAQDQAIHDKFYSTWTMPDIPHVSCCHDQDCAPVASKFEGGVWFAMKDGQWIKIPDRKIERNRDTPDGRSHLCGRWFGSDFSVFCFISGAGG